MCNMFIGRHRKEDYVIEVVQLVWPPERCMYHVDRAQKGSKGILQTERNSDKSGLTFMGVEGRFFIVRPCNRDKQVAAVLIQRGEDLGVSESLDTLVHWRNPVGVANADGIEIPKVYSKARHSAFFQFEDDAAAHPV